MRIRLAVPDHHVDAGILDAALEAVTRTDEKLIQNGEVPSVRDAIARGARWKPEPPGPEHFDLATTVNSRGFGDCDDWAPYLAAEHRVRGTDPGARAIVRRVAPGRWHAVVELSDGRIQDPSRWAGMGRKRSSSVVGALVPLMAPPGQGVLGVRRYGRGWAARCDLPWCDSPHAVSGLALAGDPYEATAGALDAACLVGDSAGVVDPEYIARAMAIDAALAGGSAEEVRDALADAGVDAGVVGSIFDTLSDVAKGAASAALPIAASMVPGGSIALPFAQSLLSKGFGGGGGGGGGAPPGGGGAAPGGAFGAPPGSYRSRGDGGPIIIRF